MKYDRFNQLKYNFSKLSQTATEESLALMEAEFELAKAAIEDAETPQAVTEAYLAGFAALYEVYEVDEDKFLRLQFLEIVAEIMEGVLDFYLSVPDDYYIVEMYYPAIEELTRGYLALANASTTPEEIEQLYQDWFAALVELPYAFNIGAMKERRNQIANELMYLLEANFEPTADEFAEIECLILEIKSTLDLTVIIPNLYDYFVAMKDYIFIVE